MKLALVCLVAAFGAGPAMAQSRQGNDPLSAAIDQSLQVSPRPLIGDARDVDATPAMRRHKVARAMALKNRAAQLLAADGGTLSPRSLAYINREAAEIRRLPG